MTPPYTLGPEDIAIRLAVAAVCGLLIGLDREIKRKTVGMRPFIIVCVGAAGFSLLTQDIVHLYSGDLEAKTLQFDPTRIIQGIITGIGFLGGGAILSRNGHVNGAATGAGIWVAGAIGVAAGYGLYWHAGLLTAYVVAILTVLGVVRVYWRPDLEDDRGTTVNDPDADK